MGDELVLDVFSMVLADCLKRRCGDSSAVSNKNSSAFNVTLDLELGGILQVDARGGILRGVNKYPRFKMAEQQFTVLGGGSLLEPVENGWAGFCKGSRIAKLPVYLHATGTQLAATDGRHRASTQSLRCIERPAFGGLRGPITIQMLTSLAKQWSRGDPRADPKRRFNLDLPIISDSGVLTAHIFPRQSAPIVDQIDQHRAAPGVVCISGFPKGLDAPRLVRSWADKYTVVLMPVDHMNFVKAAKMQKEILKLEPDLIDRVFLNPHLTNYSVWLSLLDRCNVTLTSRLHAMIVAASAQRPFRIFDEGQRKHIKMDDFVNHTFGEGLPNFRIPAGWTGSLAEVDALLSASEAARWKARYNETYEARAVVAPYEAHLAAMGKFIRSLMPRTGYAGLSSARVAVKRYFDRASVKITFE